MQCNFQAIQGQGFMTFKDPFVFPIAIFGNQTVFIQGENRDEPMAESNGSGKSNLLEALTFALFGRISKRLRYLNDVINLECDEAVVRVSFNLDGELYAVERKRNRNKTVNELHIYKEEDEQLSDSDNTEKQLFIEKLLGVSFLSYSHSIMFCQRFVAFPELKAPERAKVLSEISGATKYLKAAEIAKVKASELEKAIAEETRKAVNIKDILDSLKLNDFDKQSRIWEEEQKRTKDRHRAALKEAREKLKSLQAQHEKAVKAQRLVIATIQEKISDAEQWLVPWQETSDKKVEQANEVIKTDSQCRNLRSRITQKTRELRKMEEAKAGDCPYCGQVITEESLAAHCKELASEIEYMEREYQTLRAILQDEENFLKELNDKINSMNELKKDIRKSKERISIENERLKALEDKKEEEGIQFTINYLLNQLKEMKEQVNPFIDMGLQQAIKVDAEEVKLKAVDEEIRHLQEEKQYYVVWQENFPKLRMMLLDDIVSRLEVESQEWLSNYSSELSIEIDTERPTQSGSVRDEVHITIVTPKGKVPYEGYGGGETQKIRMSISLALSEIIADKAEREYNLVVFDEPNVGLDRVGKEANLQVFEDLTTKDKTVLIIEHDEYLQDRMGETITIVKEDHKSLIQGV